MCISVGDPQEPDSAMASGLHVDCRVEKLDPTQFGVFSNALFTHQKQYFDEAVVHKSRTEQYQSLATLASAIPASSFASKPSSATAITEDKVLTLLHISSVQDSAQSTNTGNQVTNDIKYFVKQARQTGIHVSPTALWDGIIENSISSGWTLDNWKEFVNSKL
ncbi:hypothetical protein EDD11_009166 [Mortierella claussenii]|nr:hypothetical protein EDD11_009166 [Mortierella claussenii]